MPQHLNSNREPLTKERKQGLAISALVHVILAVLIIIITFRVNIPEPTEEGLLVNFGFDETGDGLFEPAPQPVSPPPPPPSTGDIGADDALLTQEFEEAIEVKKKEPSAEEVKRQAEERAAKIIADAKRREEAEAERKRIEKEEADRRKREEDQKRIDQANARAQSAFGNAGNTGTTGTSEGIAGGKGNQGVETGTVGAPNYGPGGGPGQGLPSYVLGGRKNLSLPKPEYDYQEGGVVVVEVTVDREGKVIDAVAGVKGSSTLDGYLLKVAREAAMKAKFDRKPDAPVIQKGTITYIFKLN